MPAARRFTSRNGGSCAPTDDIANSVGQQLCNGKTLSASCCKEQLHESDGQIGMKENIVKLLFALAILVSVSSAAVSQADSSDPYGEQLVASLMKSRYLFSVVEKKINRSGDRAAIAIIRSIGTERPLTSKDIEQICFIIRLAFEAPQIISTDNDRQPRATLLLLSYLSYLPAAKESKDIIFHTQSYVVQQTKEYNIMHDRPH